MTVENLSLNVKTNITKSTTDKITSLADALENLESKASALTGVSNLTELASAMAAMSGVRISASAFTGMAAGIGKLTEALQGITPDNINTLTSLSTVMQGLSGTSVKASAFSGLAKGVENLSVALKQITPDDIANLTQLSGALKTLDGIDLSGLGNASAVTAATRHLHETAKGIDEVGRAANSAKKHTGGFINSIKRIAMYRLLRTVIKEITSAFREGKEKAYEFSAGLTGEGHRFAAAMDSLTSKGTQLKAQLGGAFIALLTALEPILVRLADLVIYLADAVSQLIAAFTGGTYLKAAAVADSFANHMSTGAASAKEWKNQLLGFDVINRLNDSSGGGGGGLTPSELFGGVDTPISQRILDFVGSLKFNIEDMLFNWDNLTPEGIARKAIGALGVFLGASAGFIIGGIPGAIIGTLTGVAITGMISSMIFDNDGVLSRTEIAELLNPALFALTGGVIGWTYGGPKGALLGASVGIGLYALIKSLTFGEDGDEKGISSKVGGIIAAFGLWKFIKLSGGLKGAWAGINGAMSGGINTAKSTMALGAPKLAIAGLAIMDALLIGYDVSKLTEAAQGYNDALETHNRTTETALNTFATLWETKGEEAAKSWAETVYGIELTGKDLETAQQELSRHMETYWDGVPQSMWEGFKQGWDAYFGKGGKGLAQLVTDAFDEMFKSLGQALGITEGGGFSSAFYGVGKTLAESVVSGIFGVSVTGAVTSVGAQAAKLAQEKLSDIDNSESEIMKKVFGTIHSTGIRLSQRAAGGFVPSGQLFLAQEEGPELVGSIGGRTAVANNDQIVEAVSSGVYQAVSSAMGGKNQNVTVHVYLDSREIKAGQNRLARATGV